MYSKPNVSMVAAVARNMSHTANVTIYGMVCDVSDYCEIEFETIDELVIHLATGNTARHPLLLFSVDGLLRQTASELYNEGDKSPSKYRISYHSTFGETRPLQFGDHIIRNFQQNVTIKDLSLQHE